MFKIESRVTGGDKIQKHLRDRRAAVRRMNGHKVEIGFLGHAAMIARQLEFGVPSRNIPERPAFRQALPEISGAIRETLAQRAAGPPDKATLERAAEAGRQAFVIAYRNYEGPGVSPSRAEAKRGTVGEGRELVGPEGERLIERIMSRLI